MKKNHCFLNVWWWMAGAWIIFNRNSGLFKSKQTRWSNISKNFFPKYRFKHFAGFHGHSIQVSHMAWCTQVVP
jgi:hypothetical protein